MTQPKWLDRYSGQTASELLALESEYRVDSLIVAFEQAIDQKAARVGAEKLTKEELMVSPLKDLNARSTTADIHSSSSTRLANTFP